MFLMIHESLQNEVRADFIWMMDNDNLYWDPRFVGDKTKDKGVLDIYSLWPIDKNEPMDVFKICQISQRGQS
jgi:hypothetical protein